ncbi:hypothetical protein ABH905_003037 [Pseudomonas frederiksbergensis]|uniref:phosphatidylserine/phosphatidylglycerophosphate/ cardiolipin synthase family protein n=1 Tax=Pseudomonas frederiksbergensis TaxID=104087 RepID=UPI003D1B8902
MKIIQSVHTQWRENGERATKPLMLFSPYLTGNLAKQILGPTLKGMVFTQFDAELFASRASDLDVIKGLMDEGHQLFHVPDLHAKVVIEQGVFATIGSQNITAKGTRNKELSVLVQGEKHLREVHRKVESWLMNATPITLEMISGMADLLPPLKSAYDGFKASCNDAQSKVDKAAEEAIQRAKHAEEEAIRQSKQVEEEKIRQVQAVKRHAKALLNAEIKAAIASVPLSEDWHCGAIKYRQSSIKTSLFISSGSLLNWKVNEKMIQLVPLSRYLCVLDTGRVGWARVAGTRISMIGREIIFHGRVISEQPGWIFQIHATENDHGEWPPGANLFISVSRIFGGRLFWLPVRFNLSTYIFFSPIVSCEGDLVEEESVCKAAIAWIKRNKASFERQVIKAILEPFKYDDKLKGIDATSFFGPLNSHHVLQITLIDGNPILVGKAGRWP